jgi:hypothetical protein
MKERPILFNAEMVRAILDGRKTQTRRIMKFVETNQPPTNPDKFIATDGFLATCPYGIPGDRLWVRETWCAVADGPIGICPGIAYRVDNSIAWRDTLPDGTTVYNASKPQIWKWRPSIHMPRWASRITLEVVSVRVERVQDIGDTDALAEGIYPITDSLSNCNGARYYFQSLWDSINAAPHAWADNPWVWVVEFRKVTL